MLAGISRYVETPYNRDVEEPACIWQRGNARILDYGMRNATTNTSLPVVLFVPSLINRYYILDLEKERSMLRFLSSQGIYPLVLDWGEPGALETDFDCGDYVRQILNPALDFLYNTTGGPVSLAGYCMGGVLTLASASLQQDKLASLILLATPWDFSCRTFAPFVLDEQWLPFVTSLIESQNAIPADIIQSLFYLTDPWVFEQKFRRFQELDPASRAAKDFIGLEHWVNDGVPMTPHVAKDCLIGWAQQNQLYRGRWKVGGRIIRPEKLTLPVLMAMPRNDHVVPYDCAKPLADVITHAQVITPSAGHVGMIVGRRSRSELWQPIADWLLSL